MCAAGTSASSSRSTTSAFVDRDRECDAAAGVCGNRCQRWSGGALQLLELVGLSDRLSHRPDQLSGGQQQRVAIARALVNRPSLVLADEPTGAVDTQTAADLLALMRSLNRDEGVTFVIVTHDMELAAKADRMIRLKDGRVLSDEAIEPSLAVATIV